MHNNPNKQLRPLHTNIIRIVVENNCLCYECSTDKILTSQDIKEIQVHVQSLDQTYIYQHPHLYSSKPVELQKIAIYLSRGESLYLNINFVQELPKISILNQIAQRFLRKLQFLYAEMISSCFNPFEDKNNTLPGLSIQTVIDVWGSGLAILPVNLHYEPCISISNAKLFLDDKKGRFLSRDDIVRVEKNKNLIHFRNGESVELGILKKIKIKNISGYELCTRTKNYLQRIKQSSVNMIEQWGIKFDSRFFQVGAAMINPGSITLRSNRGSVQKFLNDITFPMARNSYNHYFRLFFKDVAYEDKFEGQFIFFIPESLIRSVKMVIKQMQKLSERMGMSIKMSYICFTSFYQTQQLKKIVEITPKTAQSAKIMIVPHNITKEQLANLKQIQQTQINNKAFLHLIEFNEEVETEELDIIAMRHLAVIMTAFRLNPWKIKNAPFMDRPTVVAVVNVEQTLDGNLSVAIVSSLNSFFSKFIACRQITQLQRLNQTIYSLTKKCLDAFFNAHKVYPFRMFIFRSGKVHHHLSDERNHISQNLNNYFNSIKVMKKTVITYVHHSKSHPFRTFDQSDQNFISPQTVKKTQLLLTYDLSQNFYVQIEMDEPPLQISIIQPEQDPSFASRVLELTVRLIYGAPGNEFGKGLGFLDYGKKLNNYKDFNLKPWEQMLTMGLLIFL